MALQPSQRLPNPCHVHAQTHLSPASNPYSLPGIQDGLGVPFQLLHVAQELLEEVLTGRLTLQSQVHSQSLQDCAIVTQGGGVGQLR